MLERRFSEQDSIPSAGKIVFTNVDIELTPEQQVVRASANIALGICTITLPLVHRCAGMIYTIHALTNDACIVEDQDESENWQGDYTLDGKYDQVGLYSHGRKWWEIHKTTGRASASPSGSPSASASHSPSTSPSRSPSASPSASAS